jgi:carbon storage regulator
MLCLTRKTGQAIQIGSDIRITVVATRHGDVRLAIEAPMEIVITRTELLETMAANRAAVEGGLPGDPGIRIPRPDKLTARATAAAGSTREVS